eukprot:PhM_4_TR13677/c5_g1_i6/m.19450
MFSTAVSSTSPFPNNNNTSTTKSDVIASPPSDAPTAATSPFGVTCNSFEDLAVPPTTSAMDATTTVIFPVVSTEADNNVAGSMSSSDGDVFTLLRPAAMQHTPPNGMLDFVGLFAPSPQQLASNRTNNVLVEDKKTAPQQQQQGPATPRQRPAHFTATSTRCVRQPGGPSPSPLCMTTLVNSSFNARSNPMFASPSPSLCGTQAHSTNATAPITPQVSSMCDAQWALVAALDNVVHTGRLAMVALAACGAVAALRELGVPPPAVCAAKLGVCAWFVHEARSSAPASITTTTATGSSTSASMMGQTCSSPQQQQLSLSSSYNNNNNNN